MQNTHILIDYNRSMNYVIMKYNYFVLMKQKDVTQVRMASLLLKTNYFKMVLKHFFLILKTNFASRLP